MSIRDLLSRERPPALLSSLAAAAAVTCSVAAAALAMRSPSAAQLTSHFTYVARPRRLNPTVLHGFSYHSPGGKVMIRWYDSNFEPTTARAYGIASLYIDGRRVASIVKTSKLDAYEDGADELVWRGTLSQGYHAIEIRLEHSPHWGAPYTDPTKIGADGVIIASEGDNAR